MQIKTRGQCQTFANMLMKSLSLLKFYFLTDLTVYNSLYKHSMVCLLSVLLWSFIKEICTNLG